MMCHCKVKREAIEEEGAVTEWRKIDGTWTTSESDAVSVSESDAKSIVRNLRRADGVPPDYSYDYKVFEE